MSFTLYEIQKEYSIWLDDVLAAEGEVSAEMMAALDQISEKFDSKAESYAIMIKSLNGQLGMLSAEKARLQKRSEKISTTAEKLQDKLTEAMQSFGKERLETTKCSVSFRKSKSLEVVDESAIPEEYFNFKTVRSVAKAEITKAIKSGETVPGCELMEKKNIQIK